MLRTLAVLSLTALGCLLAAAVGLPTSMYFDSALPAGMAIAVLPAAGAYLGGNRDEQQLAKIVLYSLMGWILCYLLQPAVSGVARDGEHISNFKLWYGAFAFVPSSLLALIGAGFGSGQAAEGDGVNARA